MRYVGRLGEPTTLPQVLQARAELTPDDRFLHFDGAERSFGQTLNAAHQAAAALAAVGIRQGDRVALMLPNSLEFLDLWFGAALLGAVFVPINTALKDEGGAVMSGKGQMRVRKGLVVAQVALSMLLVAAGGLFARSLQNLRHFDPGFQSDGLVEFAVEPSLNGYPQPRIQDLLARIREEAARLPGVVSTSASISAVRRRSRRCARASSPNDTPDDGSSPWLPTRSIDGGRSATASRSASDRPDTTATYVSGSAASAALTRRKRRPVSVTAMPIAASSKPRWKRRDSCSSRNSR